MIGVSGQSFTNAVEYWQMTNSLAFIQVEFEGGKILHQLWISSTGRSEWKAVPEISKDFADTGRA